MGGGGNTIEFPVGNKTQEPRIKEPTPSEMIPEEKGEEGLQCIFIHTNPLPLLAEVGGRFAKRAWAAIGRDDR